MPGTQPARSTRRTSQLAAPVRGVKQALRTLCYLRAGSRYGALLTAEQLPARQPEPGPLKRYFDEHAEGPGIWKWEHYFAVYERHFRKFVGRAVDLVEIGVFSGGSLDMWRAYLGDGARIYGVDIEPACAAYEGPGKRLLIGDQSDPAFWQRFLREVPEFDIVIDDGGHQPHQQIATCEALLPRLRPGGVYVCEDLQGKFNAFHSYVHGLSLNLHDTAADVADADTSAFQRAIDSIHLYPFMAVIEKRDAVLDRLVESKRGTLWEPFYDGELFPTAGDAAESGPRRA